MEMDGGSVLCSSLLTFPMAHFNLKVIARQRTRPAVRRDVALFYDSLVYDVTSTNALSRRAAGWVRYRKISFKLRRFPALFRSGAGAITVSRGREMLMKFYETFDESRRYCTMILCC